MDYQSAVNTLEGSKTSKGHYKAEAVKLLIKELTTSRICPNCNGKGETHSACAYGGGGDYHQCHVCAGIGRI